MAQDRLFHMLITHAYAICASRVLHSKRLAGQAEATHVACITLAVLLSHLWCGLLSARSPAWSEAKQYNDWKLDLSSFSRCKCVLPDACAQCKALTISAISTGRVTWLDKLQVSKQGELQQLVLAECDLQSQPHVQRLLQQSCKMSAWQQSCQNKSWHDQQQGHRLYLLPQALLANTAEDVAAKRQP